MGAHMHGAHLGAGKQLSATFLAYQLVEAKRPLFSATVIHVPDWLALELLGHFSSLYLSTYRRCTEITDMRQASVSSGGFRASNFTC